MASVAVSLLFHLFIFAGILFFWNKSLSQKREFLTYADIITENLPLKKKGKGRAESSARETTYSVQPKDVATFGNRLPQYPSAAIDRKLQGKALLTVEINAEGKPEKFYLKEASGSRILDEAVLEVVPQWSFPKQYAGSKMNVPFVFEIID